LRSILSEHRYPPPKEYPREKILRRERDPQTLKTEIRAMREKLHAAHPNRSGLFDLKHDSGGIVDVEFIVQYLILAHAAAHPELTRNSGNLALLNSAAQAGLIPNELAEQCRIAYRTFRKLQHQLRLQGNTHARVEADSVEVHAAAVRRLWEVVFAAAGEGG